MASSYGGQDFEIVSWKDDDGLWHEGSNVDFDSAFLTTVHFTDSEGHQSWATVAGPWDDFEAWEDYVEDFIEYADEDYFG